MANDHTIFVRQGHVGAAGEANKNPSPAQSPSNVTSPIGTALKATAYIQAGKQVMNNTISNIGFITGNYDLQETAETIVSVSGIGVGLYVAPVATGIGLLINVGFQTYATGIRQRRTIYKQQQNQILLGKISVNGGRYT